MYFETDHPLKEGNVYVHCLIINLSIGMYKEIHPSRVGWSENICLPFQFLIHFSPVFFKFSLIFYLFFPLKKSFAFSYLVPLQLAVVSVPVEESSSPLPVISALNLGEPVGVFQSIFLFNFVFLFLLSALAVDKPKFVALLSLLHVVACWSPLLPQLLLQDHIVLRQWSTIEYSLVIFSCLSVIEFRYWYQ